jgi:hypothetical protein
VSRVGHFTCPVATGAVLLGQHPTLPGSSGGGCGSNGSSRDGSNAGDSRAQMQAALRVKHDPMVSALDNMTSYEHVQQVGQLCSFVWNVWGELESHSTQSTVVQ